MNDTSLKWYATLATASLPVRVSKPAAGAMAEVAEKNRPDGRKARRGRALQ